MKQKQFNRSTCYKIVSVIIIAVLAFTFAFPLYWIIIGSFKTSAAINATTPQWGHQAEESPYCGLLRHAGGDPAEGQKGADWEPPALR